MNVVHSGDTFQIYGDALKTYDALPAGTYEVGFNKFSGFFLTSHNDLVVSEGKVYGCSEKKVQKVLHSFSKVDRNFGVILSGRKGIGKSLFARLLAVHAKERAAVNSRNSVFSRHCELSVFDRAGSYCFV